MNRIASLLTSALVLTLLAPASEATHLSPKPNVSPVIQSPVGSQNTYPGSTRAISLAGKFRDPDASAAVRLSTSLGVMNFTLDGEQAPITVANFLSYVDSGRYFINDPATNTLASLFFHRSVTNFVLQTGGFLGTEDPSAPGNVRASQVPTFGPIQNEPFISNTRSTIAMAKLGGDPNSATSQWFINLQNNGHNVQGGIDQGLDVQNGGFTVFGRVAGAGMAVADAIAALPKVNAGSPFNELPVRNYTSPNPVRVQNLVSIPEFTRIAPLSFSALSSNQSIANASVNGTNLILGPGQLGSAQITLTGTDLDGASVSQNLTVNVRALDSSGDFNRDNNVDFVLVNPGTLQTAVWFLSSNNALVGGAYGPNLPPGWTLIEAADFDRDGDADYLLFNANSRETAIWYMDGAVLKAGLYGPSIVAGWDVVGVADFNGDHKFDYLLYNPASRQTAVWYLDNNVFIGGDFGPTVVPGWKLIEARDFNRDGRPDYLLMNPTTRETAIWYLSGPNFLSGVFGPTIAGGFTLVGAGDMNGDYRPDYILFNPTTRQTALWFLFDNALVGGVYGPEIAAGFNLVAP